MKKIDLKFMVPIVGKYNRSIYLCHNCNSSLIFDDKLGSTFDNMIGFANSPIGLVAIVECPVCFEKWFYHVSYGEIDTYDYFLDSIESGSNKHYSNG